MTELQPSKGGKYSCKLGDGSGFLDAVATKQVSLFIARGEIKNDQIVRVTNHTLNEIAGTQKLIWLDCEVRLARSPPEYFTLSNLPAEGGEMNVGKY